MITLAQKNSLALAYTQAKNSGHIFPDIAACEVMVESTWGTTELFRIGNNGFGEKQHHPPVFETLTLPTWEVLHGVKVPVRADFIKFPSLADCFQSRMDTLNRLKASYPDYGMALSAPDGETFARCVSRTWSTDPDRADKVLSIRHSHPEIFI
jgi:flagellum-specific peptidoglycan hydrolase FlgJ